MQIGNFERRKKHRKLNNEKKTAEERAESWRVSENVVNGVAKVFQHFIQNCVNILSFTKSNSTASSNFSVSILTHVPPHSICLSR
jgi:hypothetical protein